MQRYNMFNQIHKGLRAMMYDTALTLQHTNFMNIDEATESILKLEEVVLAFHSHAEHEDRFVLPALEKFNPALINEFGSEHEKDEMLSIDLNNLVAAYQQATDDETRLSTGYDLTMAFNDFIAFNLYHMNKEEDKINKTFWKNYSDGELVGITHAIIANIPPEDMVRANRWMMKGLNNAEISKWLSAVKNDAPDIAFRGLLSVAETELPEQRWNQIKEGLMEGAMMA